MTTKETQNKIPAKAPKMKLTERDVWLLLLLLDTRFLKRVQVERVFFSENGRMTETTKAKANRRLGKLYAHGFVERIFQPVIVGQPPAVYTLGANAYPLLSKILGQERHDLVFKKRNIKVEWLFLNHALGIAEFRVNLDLALRANPSVDLLFWKRESQELNARVSDPTGRRKYLPVTPDSFFGLKTEQGISYFFVEVDMGTETLKRFSEKIIAYKQYWKSRKYTEAYGYRHFRVLTIAESERRLVNLIDATAKAGGKNMFLFTTFAGIEKAILGEVWFSAVSESPVSLIG